MRQVIKILDEYNNKWNLNKNFTALKSLLIVLDEINPDIENKFLHLYNSNKGLFISKSILVYVQGNYPKEYEEAVKIWTVLKYKNEKNKNNGTVV